MVKASTLRTEGPGFDSCLHCWDFSRSSHTSDLETGTPVATLPGAWRLRISAGTGWSGISILLLGRMESLICNFYLSVAARKIVRVDFVPEIHLHVAGTLSNQQTTILSLCKTDQLFSPSQPWHSPSCLILAAKFGQDHLSNDRQTEKCLCMCHSAQLDTE